MKTFIVLITLKPLYVKFYLPVELLIKDATKKNKVRQIILNLLAGLLHVLLRMKKVDSGSTQRSLINNASFFIINFVANFFSGRKYLVKIHILH